MKTYLSSPATTKMEAFRIDFGTSVIDMMAPVSDEYATFKLHARLCNELDEIRYESKLDPDVFHGFVEAGSREVNMVPYTGA